MSTGDALLDTFPGRLFIQRMRSFGGLDIARDAIEAAQWAVGSYLYSDRCLGAAEVDVNDPSPPQISATPFRATDGSGYAHTQAGPYASVAHWSAVSTAWLHKPPSALVRRVPIDMSEL